MNWILSLWKRNKLRQTKDLTFKMRMESETIVSSTIEDIQRFSHNLVEQARVKRAELIGLKTSLIETFFITDYWGNKTVLKQPAFTHGKIFLAKLNKFWLALLITVLIVAEFVLYVMISENLAGNFGMIGTIGISLVFAISVLLLFSFGTDYSFLFIEAKNKYKIGQINKEQYQKAVLKFGLGIFFILLGGAFLYFAGMARVYLIEGANTALNTGDNTNQDFVEAIKNGGHAVSMAALIFTFFMSFLLGMLKKVWKESAKKIAAYKQWKKNITTQKNIVKFFQKAHASIENKIELEIEISHQLGLDLMRVYTIEVDEDNSQLLQEFRTERATSGFTINDDVFRKYHDIAMVDNRLLSYAIKQRIGIDALLGRFNDVTVKESISLEESYKHLKTINSDYNDVLKLDNDNEDIKNVA